MNKSALAADTATVTWTGTTSTDWSSGATPTNWTPNGAPGSTKVAKFDVTPANQPKLAGAIVAVDGIWTASGLTQDITISGTSSSSLRLIGTGTINGNGNTSILMDDSANHNLTIASSIGTVRLENSSQFLVNNSGTLTINSSFIKANTTTTTALTLGGTSASGAIIFTSSLQDNATGGVGAVSLIVNTAGKVTLSGTSSFTGGTTVNAGRLLVNNTNGSGLGTGAIAVNGGLLGGSGAIVQTGANGITVASGATIAPGASVGSIGSLVINTGSTTGGVAMATGSTFTFDLGTAGVSIASSGISDVLIIAGATAGDVTFNNNTVNLSGGSTGFYKLFDTDLADATLAGDTWQNLTYNLTTGLVSSGLTSVGNNFFVGTASNGGALGDIYVQVVPEPSTWFLVVGGLSALVLRRRYRRAS